MQVVIPSHPPGWSLLLPTLLLLTLHPWQAAAAAASGDPLLPDQSPSCHLGRHQPAPSRRTPPPPLLGGARPLSPTATAVLMMASMAAPCPCSLRVQRGEDVAWIYDQVSGPSAPVEVSQRLAAEMVGERLVTALCYWIQQWYARLSSSPWACPSQAERQAQPSWRNCLGGPS